MKLSLSKKQPWIALLGLMCVVSTVSLAQVNPGGTTQDPPARVARLEINRNGETFLIPALKKESDYRVGDQLVFVRRGTQGLEIVGKGKIVRVRRDSDQANDAIICELTDFSNGPRIYDEAYITNRNDSDYSFVNIILRRKPK